MLGFNLEFWEIEDLTVTAMLRLQFFIKCDTNESTQDLI